MKPISIQLYTVRDIAAKDFFGTLKQIADIGYKGVEPAGFHGKSPAELHKVLNDLGMVCSSVHGPLVNKDNVAEQVATAKTLGYDTIISGVGPDDFKTMDGIKAAAAKFQAAAELLKPHGLKMGYHNHWWEMDIIDGKLGLEHFLGLAKDVVSELDMYWASNFGQVDVPALIKKLGKRIPFLHAKDGPLVKDQPHTANGKGKMPLGACIKAADEATLKWVVVELDACATDMLTAVRDSYTYLTGQKLAQGRK